jgi:hypothetical protein
VEQPSRITDSLQEWGGRFKRVMDGCKYLAAGLVCAHPWQFRSWLNTAKLFREEDSGCPPGYIAVFHSGTTHT